MRLLHCSSPFSGPGGRSQAVAERAQRVGGQADLPGLADPAVLPHRDLRAEALGHLIEIRLPQSATNTSRPPASTNTPTRNSRSERSQEPPRSEQKQADTAPQTRSPRSTTASDYAERITTRNPAQHGKHGQASRYST